MTHIAGEVTIAAPVGEVFDMVADERNEPRYNPRIVRAEKVSEGPVSRGARFVAEPKGMGAKGQMTIEVVEYDRPHRLRTVVRSSYMQVAGTVTFEEVDGGTQLSWDWDASRGTWSPIAAEPVHHDDQSRQTRGGRRARGPVTCRGSPWTSVSRLSGRRGVGVSLEEPTKLAPASRRR